MQRHVFTDGASRYTRISKLQAEKLFNQGKPFYAIAHKMRPGFPFSMGMMIDSAKHLEDWQSSYPSGHPTVPDLTAFGRMLNNFCYYNANCHETGYYAAFYTVTEKH